MEYCCGTMAIVLIEYILFGALVRNDWHYLVPTLSPCRRWASIALMSVFNLNIWDSTRAFSRCNSVISASKVNRSSPPFPILQSKNHNFFTFPPPQILFCLFIKNCNNPTILPDKDNLITMLTIMKLFRAIHVMI